MWSDNVRARTRALIEGKVFCTGYVFSAVANGASVLAHIRGGVTPVLLDMNIVAGGKVLVQPSQGNAYSNDGTALVFRNRNLESALVCDAAAFYTPTVSAPGTNFAPTLVEGSSGSGAGGTRVGAESSDDYGFLLNNGNDILLTLTNQSGAAIDINVLFFVTQLP